MASQSSRQNPDAELQAAFRRHLPLRLRTLMRRARAQCRMGWDFNVLHSLHDEIAQLAGACGRYGLLDLGERLLALESALASPLSAQAIPDAALSTTIDELLDSLRPQLQQMSPGYGAVAPVQASTPAAIAGAAFPRCEMPPADYGLRFGSPDAPDAAQAAPPPADGASLPAPAPEAVPPHEPEIPRGPRVRILNDDEPLVNELLLRLEQQGCEVVLLERWDALIGQLTGSAPPDLAILVAEPRTPLEQLGAVLREIRRDAVRRVRLLVLLRDAGVELRLRALRAGADRCIALPAGSEETVNAALELAGVEEESPYRVLIVDDDAAQALFAQAVLRRAGMETRVLGESLPVLNELDQFHPDLLLLDLNMPDCDGFELTTLIREREGYLNTPIVFLSGEQDEDRQFAALDAGGDDFLVKPIRPTHLVSAVTNRVRRARTAVARKRQTRQRDDVTGLHEDARLLDALSEHLAVSSGGSAPGGLLAVEVRDADALRERIGAANFDQVVGELGRFILPRVQPGAMTARHGEAGFLVFAPAGSEKSLLTLATELNTAANDERFGGQALALDLNCAVCAFDGVISESAAALAAVEHTLGSARRQPDRIAAYSACVSAPDALPARITAALAQGSFELAFQPVIPIRGAASPHYQALLRLRHGGREFLAAELVPVAIEMGSIGAVDEWVVQRCIGILAEHQRDGRQIRLFASQSVHGWRDGARSDRILARLAEARVAAQSLVLEFRCTEVRADPGAVGRLARALMPAGVRFSLAEADAEIVASAWLDEVPFDFVKLSPDLADATLEEAVRAVHARGMRAVAPRIETADRVDALRAANVDLLQGNYFRSPAAALDHEFGGEGP